MSNEIQDLTKQFESFRKKKNGKKATYPATLRKKAAYHAQNGEKSSSLATAFGVSDASIKAWIKKFPAKDEQPFEAEDFIPVHQSSSINGPNQADLDPGKDLRMKIVSIELKGPQALLMQSLHEVLHSLSGGVA